MSLKSRLVDKCFDVGEVAFGDAAAVVVDALKFVWVVDEEADVQGLLRLEDEDGAPGFFGGQVV